MASSIVNKLPWKIQSKLKMRPDGAYKSFAYYNDKFPNNCEIQNIFGEGWSLLTPPKTWNGIIPHNFHEVLAEKQNKVDIVKLKNCSIYSFDNTYGVITHDNKVIEDNTFRHESKYNNNHPFLSIQSIPKAKKIKGKALILAVSGGDTFHWHWMLDSVPKYGIMELARITEKDFDYIVINEMNLASHKGVLEKLKIPMEKIIELKNNERLQFDEISIPTDIRYNEFVIHYLRTRFSPQHNEKASKRLFVSRNNARWRKIKNEEQIFNFLEKNYGFQKVYFENMTFEEQAELASKTEATFSLVGSNQVNMVFYPKGGKIIEVQPEGLANVANWITSEQCKHEYCYFEAKNADAKDKEELQYRDVVIDIDRLSELMKKMF